jgi:exodeoxyribonuclease VII large subunit
MSLLFNQTKTVSELTTHIRDLFDADMLLQDVWVSGEVSNMARAQSGHWYFTLKDNDAQIRCVMWRSSVSKQSTIPQNGDAIEAHGKVSVYEPRGEYQLYTDLIRPVGIGDLYQQFDKLKRKLSDEGLFADERKREFPAFPDQIGVITSPTAAAFQDILNVLRRRFPLAEVILSPTQVQGATAPAQIIAALERLNEYTDVDVILMCRGGGSIEDLWSFNDEEVVRAVAASGIPVVTGVGHETDFTIVDFVSDLRAPTPSAAAEQAVPDISDIHTGLRLLSEKLDGMMYDAIISRRNELESLQNALKYTSPETFVRQNRQHIDVINNRIVQSQKTKLTLLHERLKGRISALEAANPKAILSRGYAIVIRDEDGKRIISEYDATPGTGITIQLKDGQLKARIEDKETHGRYKRTLF